MDSEEVSQLCQMVGTRARRARLARGLIQEEVAERLGVTTEFYGRIERAYALPSVRTLYRLAVILDVSADCLIGSQEMPEFEPPFQPSCSRLEQRNKKLMRRLRAASPQTLRAVKWMLDALARAAR